MNGRALIEKVRTGNIMSVATLKLLFHGNYHPGPAPQMPLDPGKKAGLIARLWYWREKRKWKDHHKKKSPFWDWYRTYMKSGYWLKEVRPKALWRAGFQCEYRSHGKRCKATDNLQVHHTATGYRHVGQELESGSLCPGLHVYCEFHHDQVHGKLPDRSRSHRGAALIRKILFGF